MNAENTAVATPGGLPFLQAATKGPGALFRNFFPFLQMAAIPILLFMLSSLAIQLYTPWYIAAFLVSLSDLAMTTIFGMAWLGYLLQPESDRRIWLPRWSRQHWLFLFYSLCISGLTALQGPILIFIIDDWPGLYRSNGLFMGILFGLPSDYIHASIGLAFCALAVKRPGGVLWSWRTIGWSALKIVLVVSVASFCFTFAGNFIGGFIGTLSAALELPDLLSALPQIFADYASYAVTLGVLAVAYRHYTGWPGVPQEIVERFD